MKRLIGLLILTVLTACPAAWAQPKVLDLDVSLQRKSAHPGDQIALAITLNLEDGWHAWPTRSRGEVPTGMSDGDVYWTRIGLAGSGQDDWAWADERVQPANETLDGVLLAFGDAQWPEAHSVQTGAASEAILAYSSGAVVYVPIVISADAAVGARTFEIGVHYQACDDHSCLPPDLTTATVTLDIVESTAPVGAAQAAALFADFDPSVFGRLGQQSDEPIASSARFDFFGWGFSLGSNQYVLILLIAAVAGFLLNLTPCVLPVIPLKVISLQKQAGNPAKLTLYGTVYCVGIVSTFAVFGVLIAVMRQQWGELFAHAWFAGGMGILVFVLGLGMVGLFTLRLPNAVYMVNPAGDTVQGNFLMGVLTAILSTPCTGPFLGAALAWAATQPAWLGFATLLVMGIGMAFPYALLIAFPKLMDRMPKAGPGGELLKQVMGVLLISVSLYLFSNLIHGEWMWWVIGGVAAGGFAWAIIGGVRALRTKTAKVATAFVGVLGVAASLAVAQAMARPSDINWVKFRAGETGIQATIDDALADGKVVVVKFTAQWCVNCHVIERQVFNDPESRELLNQPYVVAIKVDLTDRDDNEGWPLLKQYSGGTGIPFSIFFGPGLDEPISYASFFKVSDLKSSVQAARGG